jgi:hypothetical protein
MNTFMINRIFNIFLFALVYIPIRESDSVILLCYVKLA